MTRLAASSLFILTLTAGCADDVGKSSDGTSMSDRQNAALRDPMSYSPDMPNSKAPPAPGTVTPRDDSLKGQWDRFWNP